VSISARVGVVRNPSAILRDVSRIKAWALWLAVWEVVWLAVGEALYRGAGWDRFLSGFIGILVASAVTGWFEAKRE
jgi:hypothetical protein